MTYPYLCPCDAPWTAEYRESYGRRLDPEYDDIPEDYALDEEDASEEVNPFAPSFPVSSADLSRTG